MKAGYPRAYHSPQDSYRELSGTIQQMSTHRQRKSLEAFERMILDYSNEEDLVYDPFSGGGTTALASYRTRRKFVGSEIVRAHVRTVEQQIAALEGQRGCDVTESGQLRCDEYIDRTDSEDLEDWSDVITNV